MNCLQVLNHIWGIHSFPPGTNQREMQLTGFICGWFSSWHLVINLLAEGEASVSFSHAVPHYCDSACTWFWLCLCFQKWHWQLSVLCRRLSYHQAILESLCPLFLAGGVSGAASLAFLGCADLHDYVLFWCVLWGNLSVPYTRMILAHYHSCRNCCGLLSLASVMLHSKVSVPS